MISPMPMLQTPIDAEAGVGTNGGRRPTVVAAPASASPELSSDRPRRRRFTVEDKLRILTETDRATATGGIGAILYLAHAIIRNFVGNMIRKLSETSSQ